MRNYRDDSISRKLTRLNMLVAGLALILACSSFVGFDIWTFRQGSIRNLTIQARFVATNTLAAIEANDSPRIASVLTSLQEVPNIMSATIYSPDGRIVSVYRRDSSVSVPVFSGGLKGISDRHWFRSHDVNLIYVIRDHDRVIGSIYIQTDTQRLHERLIRYLQIVCVVMIASLLAAYLLSAGARSSISDPIIHLATIAKIVSRDRNYQLRATPSKSRDEIGMLIQSFNEMLGHIEARDADLQKAHDELDRRVVERTVELEAANKELESFSYSVSHDLRSPLRSIDGFSQALLEDCSQILDAQGRSHLARIRAATERMGKLIDDFLNLARVTRTEIHLENVDITSLAHSIASDLRASAPQRRVDITIQPGLEARADPSLLHLSLANLFENAWKFTSKRPAARIEFGRAAGNSHSTFFIRDNGAGFDPAHAANLFGTFRRLHAAAEFPGTGIGLATVQRVVQRHGGIIWAESQPNRGATFYFTLTRGKS
jgi:signal transduction histidine kinase